MRALCGYLMVGLCVVMLGASAAALWAAEADCVQSFHKLSREITLLNLLNGLELTGEQTDELIGVLEQCRADQQASEEAMRRALSEAVAAYADYRNALIAGPEVPRQIEHLAVRAEIRLQEARENQQRYRRRYVDLVREILTENQIALIDEFVPCLVPPAPTRDTTNIGAPTDSQPSRIVAALEKVRMCSDEQFLAIQNTLVDEALQIMFHEKVELSAAYRAVAEKEILDVAQRARAMSVAEFEASKYRLADELRPIHRLRTQQMHDYEGEFGREKLIDFMLDPLMLNLLRERKERVS